MEDPFIFADEKTLDASLQNQYVQHIMTKSLPISIQSMSNSLHIVGSSDFSVALARGFSRLDTIFLTLYNTEQAGTKSVNTFYHPNGTGVLTRAGDSVRLSVQVGSQKFPIYEISSLAEFYMRLQAAVGAHIGDNAMNISTRQYSSSSFIAALDLQKLSGTGAEYSGLNTKNGELLTASWKGVGNANQCYITLVYSAILNIRDGGVEELS